jgi:hypothetical protein
MGGDLVDQQGTPQGEGQFVEQRGFGQGYYVIGLGPDRNCGQVEVTLRTLATPGQWSVEWNVETDLIPDEIRELILSDANANLRWYLESHPEYGLGMTIDKVSADDMNHHNFKRATLLALYFSLHDASLPVPEIYE